MRVHWNVKTATTMFLARRPYRRGRCSTDGFSFWYRGEPVAQWVGNRIEFWKCPTKRCAPVVEYAREQVYGAKKE